MAAVFFRPLRFLNMSVAQFHCSVAQNCNKMLEVTPKNVSHKGQVFVTAHNKDKQTFLKIIDSFQNARKLKRSHVEFIYAALKSMEEFDVHEDIACYKALMDIFPKGKMVPKNLVQAEFFYFPKHQYCALELLEKMQRNEVIPDKEMGELIKNIFGRSSQVYKTLSRMLYWMRKFSNLNPYKLPKPLPSDVEVLAEMALKKMSVDPRTHITHFKTEDLENSIDYTWIVSAQSLIQQRLLQKHDKEKPLYVEGPYLEWMAKLNLWYFVLRADAPKRNIIEIDDDDVSNLSLHMFGEPKAKDSIVSPLSVHEQDEGTIFSMCITGTSSKDSVLSWIRFLQSSNPNLEKIPVLFSLRSPPTALTTVNATKYKLEDASKA